MKLSISAALLLALGAGAAAPRAVAGGAPAQLAPHAQAYRQLFAQASLEFNVPLALLQAIAYAETRWHPHVPKGQAKKAAEPEVEIATHGGMPPGYGIMGLRDDGYFGYKLGEAAALLRVAPDLVRNDTRTNIRAGAALLAHYGGRKTRAFPLEEWEPALARYSGIAQREIADLYTHEVFAAIRQGRASDQFKIDRRHVDMEKIYGKDRLRRLSARRITVAPGHAPAAWNPAASCNYSARSAAVSHVTVHTTQGSYAGTISWFQNCAAGVSAHYVVRSSDGQVTQMVNEADKAWHAGSANGYSVGIEHEGYVGDPGAWYTSAMYKASAALARNILASRGLARNVYDGAGGWNAVLPDADFAVKGHVNFASQWHTDPGTGWDWPRYKALVAGGASPLRWPQVRYGNTGERVRTIQYLLQQWGYGLTADGGFGSATLDAIKRFQAAQGLGADGLVGNATWPALIMAAQQGDAGAKVRALQSQLVQSGYGVTVDGVFGAGTTAAVRSFQGARGIMVDGVVNESTWNKLAW